MKKLMLLGLFLPFLWSCGDDSTYPPTKNTNDEQNKDAGVNDNPDQVSDSNVSGPAELANSFCTNQKPLQIISTSLLSAFHVMGNGSDRNYCGGQIILDTTAEDFSIAIEDYCVEARGQQVTINGSIIGAIESGANFTSEVSYLTITGDGVDLAITGRTWDGRADDMFMSLTITNNLNNTQITLDEVSIKKGEFDFGFLTIDELDRVEFKFIEHFNADLTRGELFIYGKNDELLIISADEGSIFVVFKDSKQDPGTLLDSSCSSIN